MEPLTIIDDKRVLFQDEVYTKDVYWGEEINLNRTKLLYTPSNTSIHFKEESERKEFLQRLLIMKSAITDQRIPSSVVHEWMEEYPYDSGEADIYFLEERYGRDEILKSVEKYHFKEALPEVRQVVLHDTCPYLKTVAMSTLTSLGGRIAAQTLCEKLRDTSDLIIVREAAALGLKAFSFTASVKPLVDTFHETAYTNPMEFYSKEKELMGGEENFEYQVYQKLYRREWMPLLCLDALSNIPTEESLQTLEQAVKVGVSEINEQARDSIIHWIDVNTKIIKEKVQRFGVIPEIRDRLDIMRKLIYTYDITSKTKFYDTPFGRIRAP